MGRQKILVKSKKLLLIKDTLYRRGKGTQMHPRQPKFIIAASKEMGNDEFETVCQFVDPTKNRTTSGRKIVYKNLNEAEADWSLLMLMFA